MFLSNTGLTRRNMVFIFLWLRSRDTYVNTYSYSTRRMATSVSASVKSVLNNKLESYKRYCRTPSRISRHNNNKHSPPCRLRG